MMLRSNFLSGNILIIFFAVVSSYNYVIFKSPRRCSTKLYAESSNSENLNFKSGLWNDQIEFVDLTSSAIQDASRVIREIPLFLLGNPMFPQATTALNVFEMKYRTMMYDIARSDDTFGYHYIAGNQIAAYGTKCKIVDRQLLGDGRQAIEVEGIGRYKINRISKTIPYVVAEIEDDILDDPPENEEEAQALEIQTYSNVKYLWRIQNLCLKPARSFPYSLKRTRYTTKESLADATRRSNFSLALSWIINLDGKSGQLLLQTRNVIERLKVQDEFFTAVTKAFVPYGVEKKLFTESQANIIREQSFRLDDSDEDLMPEDIVRNDKSVEKDEWDLSNLE